MSGNAALLALFVLPGLALGLGFFASLRQTVAWAMSGRALLVAAVTLARFAVLGVGLWLIGREGAGPLLAATLGIMIARWLVLRAAQPEGGRQ